MNIPHFLRPYLNHEQALTLVNGLANRRTFLAELRQTPGCERAAAEIETQVQIIEQFATSFQSRVADLADKYERLEAAKKDEATALELYMCGTEDPKEAVDLWRKREIAGAKLRFAAHEFEVARLAMPAMGAMPNSGTAQMAAIEVIRTMASVCANRIFRSGRSLQNVEEAVWENWLTLGNDVVLTWGPYYLERTCAEAEGVWKKHEDDSNAMAKHKETHHPDPATLREMWQKLLSDRAKRAA